MAVNFKSFALNDQIAGTSDASPDTLYTANNGIAQIRKATARNTDASAVTVDIYILPNGTAASSAQPIVSKSVGAGSTVSIPEIEGHVVPDTGTIQAFAGTTNVIYLSISGIEIQ